MKSHVSGRVVPQPGSSGCRPPPQNLFYNHHGITPHHQPQQQPHHQQHHHQQQQQKLAYHPHHHHQPPPPPSQQQHQNYAMLQCFSQHTSNGWAGIPLISTAASSNRRQRKPTVATHRSPPPLQAMSCNSLHMYNSNRDPHSNDYDMTRLAMHAQGAPLLLTGSYNRNRMNNSSNRQMRAMNPAGVPPEGYTCNYKPNVGPLSLHQKAKENNISGPIGANVEPAAACLPRIIKPRKRRKKDRKPQPPSTVNFVKTDIEPEAAVVPTNLQQHHHHHHQHLNQQHHPQMHGFDFETECNLRKDDIEQQQPPPIEMHQQQDAATGSVCFCRQCDPLSRIWAFPLRRSHSDNSSDNTDFERATKNVGVIGSNRSNLIKNTNAGSLSDSSDSGYGDILSGIHIGDDIFSNSYQQLQKLPSDLLLSPTAESLLTESINEISRKLMETCDIKGATNGGSISPSSSSDSCSVFSDSGISSATSSHHPSGDELIFNFENLSINSTDHHHLFPTNDPIFDCFTSTPAADINNNNIAPDGGGSPRIDPQFLSCLDMLWGTQQPDKQQSSSSSSFYRPTVASM